MHIFIVCEFLSCGLVCLEFWHLANMWGSRFVKGNIFRKSWIEEYEQLKKEVGVRFGEEYVRNFSKIISKLAQYHYKKKGLILGKEKEIYAFLLENGHNPFKIYRWCLLERIPETIRFQLKNEMINQKTALHMHFKNRHESKNSVCVEIRV